MTDQFTKEWITTNSIAVLEGYSDKITLRQLYYRLVAKGLINDMNHYKRVINAIGDARWNGDIEFNAFVDRERSMYGETNAEPVILLDQIERAKEQIGLWMKSYHLNKWENQPEYIEVWIEKKALQGVFERPCQRFDIGLAPCKGYPSLTFLKDAQERFEEAIDRNQNPTILYFGDFDPSGVDIPRSLIENISKMGCEVNIERIALNQDQIIEMHLPSAPAKTTDTRTKNWNGEGVVELDAVEPNTLIQMVEKAIQSHFDTTMYNTLNDRENIERELYQTALKIFVQGL